MKLDDFLKCKKVRCLSNDYDFNEQGKAYKLHGLRVFITDETGCKAFLPIEDFEPVLDPAENPLRNAELTPELEAVEPVLSDNCVNIQDIDTDILDTNTDIKDTPKFKAGDKVYFGTDPDIKTISEVGNDNDVQFAGEFGWASGYSYCHATPENYERLQATFTDIEFERPPTQADIDNEAVDKLARAMKNKLAKKREQGYHGWETCKHGDLVQLLINHVDKGDPIDVANFCAFLFARGESLTGGDAR